MLFLRPSFGKNPLLPHQGQGCVAGAPAVPTRRSAQLLAVANQLAALRCTLRLWPLLFRAYPSRQVCVLKYWFSREATAVSVAHESNRLSQNNMSFCPIATSTGAVIAVVLPGCIYSFTVLNCPSVSVSFRISSRAITAGSAFGV